MNLLLLKVIRIVTGLRLLLVVLPFTTSTDMPSTVVISRDDSSVLVNVPDDSYFRKWDIQSGKLLDIWPKAEGAVISSLSFSPVGKYILSGDNDGRVQIWKVGSYQPVQTFNHPCMVYIASYSPDGKFIWTGCSDGKVRQWDAATEQLVRVFDGPRGISWIDDISPDGRQILIEYDDQLVHLFDVDYHDTIRYACSRLVRDLTVEEKDVYHILLTAPTCPKQ
jgi:WD40 repeat protein